MTRRLAALFLALCLCAGAPEEPAAHALGVDPPTDDATLFRIFLTDGTSLVSYGELARVGDRVVFSMPTSALPSDPQLQLINLSADRIDWDRTSRYAESARANQYLAVRASEDYAILTNEVAQALNDVARATDPASRIAIVEKARKMLAEWPPNHFNYKQADVMQMLDMLDEAIADLRAAAGADRFNLNFVAGSVPLPPAEPLLPPPTPQETIAQALTAARLTDVPADRTTLLTVVLNGLERDAEALPFEWASTVAATVRAEVAREIEADRSYQALSNRMLSLAKTRTRTADVRGVQRVIDETRARDAALGTRRPDVVNALLESLEAELDAARRLRLARDQWALRAPGYREYRAALSLSMRRFARLKPALEDIKLLAGSSAGTLVTIQHVARQIQRTISKINPPDDLQTTHSLLMSAASLAENAASIRREAALAADMSRAWDASAAAAGSLMLTTRAQSDLRASLRLPQLPK